MKKTLVLGTAQLNKINYGISKDRIKLSNKRIFEILNFAWSKGITHYDCSPLYKNEKLIGQFILKKKVNHKINIITKIPKINSKNILNFCSKSLNLMTISFIALEYIGNTSARPFSFPLSKLIL